MNSIEKKLHYQILDYLNREQIPQDCTLLVALSGGPDSTALLHLLNTIKDRYPFQLAAAYVNHGLRDPSDLTDDDSFVLNLTDSLDIEFFSAHAEPGELKKKAKDHKLSLEEAARQYRYDFFFQLMKDLDNPYLLLGHNLDDQMETMIIRFFQGAGIEGLKGIPHHNGNILRPLIHVRKKEVLDYLQENKLQYRIDSSNKENDFLRNKVRNLIMPQLEDVFPGLEKGLLSQEARFTALNTLHTEQSDQVPMESDEKSCRVPLGAFEESDTFIRKRVLYKMFDKLYRGDKSAFRLPVSFLNPLMAKTIPVGRVFAEAHGVKISSTEGSLIMSVSESLDEGFFAVLSDEVTSIPGKYTVKMGQMSPSAIPLSVHKDSVLIFRSSLSGDSMKTEKGNISLRKGQPVLEDSHGIVAVFGAQEGGDNLYRKKKINASEKFYILYLEVGKEF